MKHLLSTLTKFMQLQAPAWSCDYDRVNSIPGGSGS
jgi:hypothetical protein